MSTRALVVFALFAAAGACREDKRAARERADIAPVEVATTPEQLLREGAIERIQAALAEAGHAAAWDEGALDAATTGAIASFQKSQGLPATGVPDRKTVSKLGLGAGEVFERLPRD